MYLMINSQRHTCTRRIVKGGTVRYLSVTPEVADISGMIRMFRDDGFLLSEDSADSYERRRQVGTLLELSNDPEPVPAPAAPTVEQRVTALENAIKEGLSL